jgi:hypothetical protein
MLLIIVGMYLGSMLGGWGMIVGAIVGIFAGASMGSQPAEPSFSDHRDPFWLRHENPTEHDDGSPFDSAISATEMHHSTLPSGQINPATGLPMLDDFGGVDVAGNPYGTDLVSHDSFTDSSFESFSSNMDSFSSGMDRFSSDMDSFSSSGIDSFDSGGFNDRW